MKVRQSTLKSFGACARQYYYANVEQVPAEDKVGSLTVLGTVFHFAMEVYETYGYDLDLGIRTFNKYWSHPELLGETIDFWHNRTNPTSLRKRGIKMLKAYHELQPWMDGRLLGNEINFTVPIAEHELTGTIDKLWLREGRNTLQVIDFKTGYAVPKKLRENIQFTAYAYATTTFEFWDQLGHPELYDKFKGYRRQGIWYHARDGKQFNAGYRGKVDYRRLLLAIQEMDNAVKAGVFPLDITGESCGWCPFADGICGAENSEHFVDYID